MATVLQAPGMRRSKQRDQIFAYLCQSKEHPSAEMIFEGLRETVPNLSLATVYRNLALLEKLGQLQKVSALGASDRYDARLDAHGHFACVKCGAIHDLEPIEQCLIQQFGGLGQDVEIIRSDITFHGCCAQCRASQAAG